MPDAAMDFELLARRTLNNAGLMAEMLLLFRHDTADRLAAFQAAVRADDLPAAAKLAHRLKSSAVTISAITLGTLLEDAETQCAAGRGENARTLLPRIADEFAQCLSEMNARGV